MVHVRVFNKAGQLVGPIEQPRLELLSGCYELSLPATIVQLDATVWGDEQTAA